MPCTIEAALGAPSRSNPTNSFGVTPPEPRNGASPASAGLSSSGRLAPGAARSSASLACAECKVAAIASASRPGLACT